jgi:tripartite-type tricarboxylate transporter receptor subunit TctC
MGGHIDVNVGGAFGAYTLERNLRSIAIGWDERSELWPEVPTILEATGDVKLNEVAKSLASLRGVLVSRKFKDDYPERFQKFVEAYKKAYHSEGHMADAKKTGQTPIMYWIGPDESEKLSAVADKVVAEYARYFTK